jgi:hypothetical protein
LTVPGGLITIALHSALAQLVEQLTVNQWVAGSSPAGGAKSGKVSERVATAALFFACFTPEPGFGAGRAGIPVTAGLLPRLKAPGIAAFLVVTLVLLCFPAAGRTDPSSCWEELVFTAGNNWATASSTLKYRQIPAREAALSLMHPAVKNALQPQGQSVGVISVEFSAMRSQGEQQLWIDPVTGAALQSRRIGHGRDSRLKLHRFLRSGVWRERRSPDETSPPSSPDTWPLRSATEITYPPEAQSHPVIAPLMLLARASSLALRARPGKLDEIVLGDTRLHRVVLESREDASAQVNLTVRTGAKEEQLSGTRAVRRVDLRPHLLGDGEDDEAFSLLELEGETTLTIDRATGLPLRIEGQWMRVGAVAVTLTQATISGGCRP